MNYLEVRKLLITNHEVDDVVAHGAAAVPGLVEHLTDSTWLLRLRAIKALEKIAEKFPEFDSGKVVPALLSAVLKGEMGEERSEASRLLAKICDYSVIVALNEKLKRGNPDARGAALTLKVIFGQRPEYDYTETIACLLGLLKSEDRETSMAAARTLLDLGLDKIKKPEDRVHCLVLVGDDDKLKDMEGSAPALIEYLKCADVRQWIADVLAGIAERRDVDLRAVQKTLQEFVDSVKESGGPAEILKAQKEARGQYMKICEAARKRIAKKHSLAGDCMLLVGEFPRQPHDKMYRTAGQRATLPAS